MTPSAPELVLKYAVPAPRYTSYPSVPLWTGGVDGRAWAEALAAEARASGGAPLGVSLYVHLPFCESLCTFCGCHKVVTRNHAVEESYVDSLLAEWRLHSAAGMGRLRIASIHLGGGTPTFFSPRSLERLLGGLAPDVLDPASFEGSLEAHPNSTTAEHLDLLARYGFRRLSMGVQDFDPRVLEAIGRPQPFETVERVARLARERGFDGVNFDIIHGLPHQTVGTMRETFRRVVGLSPDRVAFYAYAHVPTLKPSQSTFDATALPGPSERRALFDAGRDILVAHGYEALGMDHFARSDDPLAVAAREGRLHRNFMGYSVNPGRILVGLGISAIGEIDGLLFAQNAKSLPEWKAAVAAGELPVVAGHGLDDEDRAVRRIILDLMCRGRAAWGADSARLPFLRDALERLATLEDDGLVRLLAEGVEVTERGRDFLRNVCMSLDARLWREKPGTRLFSAAV